MSVEYTVLENAFDFLSDSISNLALIRIDSPPEEFKKRLIKYSILHLSSGIELLFKYRLNKEHWTYIFRDMNKANKLALQRGDFESSGLKECIDRLNNLCEICISDENINILQTLRNKRNKTEHFRLIDTLETMESITEKVLAFAIEFIASQCDFSEFSDDESELFEYIKEETKNLEGVLQSREKLIYQEAVNSGCKEALVKCPECQRVFLLCEEGDVRCLFCGYEDVPEDAASLYLLNIYGISEYEYRKDGGVFPIYNCPNCGTESFIYHPPGDYTFCFNCGYQPRISEIDQCGVCGELYVSEPEGLCGICNFCFKQKIDDVHT